MGIFLRDQKKRYREAEDYFMKGYELELAPHKLMSNLQLAILYFKMKDR